MDAIIVSDVPARLDRLPWSNWHRLVVVALGITWLLDGLEVTLSSSLIGILKDPRTLGLSDTQFGFTGTAYLLGAVLGAVIFGYATDRFGRRKLFFLTLLLYLSATAATALSWNFASYLVFRALTGAGIGGEYAAVNSAVDELIPARVRGHVDLIVNATFWIGAAVGSCASIVLLHLEFIPVTLSWRFAFGIGAVLGLGILLLRRHVPESPRWLLTHGEKGEAERVVAEIEGRVAEETGPLPRAEGTIRLRVRSHTPWREIRDAIFHRSPERSWLALALMISQAFFYNAVLFTYGLVLLRYYGVSSVALGYYLLPLALGNFLGPLLIGRLFDTVGRRFMIALTYAGSGLLLAISGWLFAQGLLTAWTQAAAWSVTFFVASSAASSAYLTVSEIFPLEIRALAIAIFYACGTFAGGVGGPALFGYLSETGNRYNLLWGYLAAAALMAGAAIVEWRYGVAAERQALEAVCDPLNRVPDECAE